MPGSLLLREIREQPAALTRLLEHRAEYEAVARLARDRGVNIVRLVGHGSSDNAASYGVYAFGLLPGWTAFRDSISLSVYYGSEVDLHDSCVVALSQSGRTPDVLEYVDRARARGAFTIALTNESDSPLAESADAVLPLAAGPELGIAATKTYTTQVAALALLAAYSAEDGDRVADGVREVTQLLDDLLPGPRAASLGGRGRARLRRAHVRDRARHRVRDRSRDLVEAARDVPRRCGPADGHRLRPWPGGGARRSLPRLDDRRRRSLAPGGSRGCSSRPEGRRDCCWPAEPRLPRSRMPTTTCRFRSRRCRCWPRSCPSCPARCWPGRWRRRRASTLTIRTA